MRRPTAPPVQTLEFELAGIPLIVEYRVYFADPRDRDPETTIEIESALVAGTDLEIDTDYPINRDTIGAHIESIIFSHEEQWRREAQ